jgi:hypothetical protein
MVVLTRPKTAQRPVSGHLDDVVILDSDCFAILPSLKAGNDAS